MSDVCRIDSAAGKHELIGHKRRFCPALAHQDTRCRVAITKHNYRAGVAYRGLVDGWAAAHVAA